MIYKSALKAELVRPGRTVPHRNGGPAVLAIAAGIGALSLGLATAAAYGSPAPILSSPAITAPAPTPRVEPTPAPQVPVWEGRDIDGDGAPDFANPTGKPPRGHDVFGDGYFRARRDGGSRAHEGVDYDARPGQSIASPISGFVARIGYAYPGDERFKYVEIDNPALHFDARVFYVDPSVETGQPVALGDRIGTAHSLQARYAGITDHVHLEIAERGRRIDAETVILARNEAAGAAAGMSRAQTPASSAMSPRSRSRSTPGRRLS